MKGIDISNWQKGLDLSKASVDFAIFKASGGKSYKDPTCENFVKQAKAKGILWGFYHFARDGQASQSGSAEADFFIKCTEGYWGSGLPVLDLEDNGISDWAKYTKDFVNRIYEKKKVYPVIYTGLRGIAALKGTDVLKKCKVWFAGYPKGYISYWLPESDKPHNYYDIDSSAQIIMWQFTSNVPVSGFNVDANLCYITKAAWQKLCKSSKPSTPAKTDTTMQKKVAKFVARMLYWCQTVSLGYDQSNRWDIRKDGECDCATLVYWCLWEAGLLTKPSGNLYNILLYTGTIRAHLKAAGWTEIAPNIANCQVGDILLNDGNHVAVVVSGSGWSAHVAQASIDENGRIVGGRGGDQTGNETNVRKVYNYPWSVIMRPPASPAPSPTPAPKKPTVKFRVKQNGKWQKEGFVGTKGKKIQAIAIKMNGWYQVKTRKHGWLPPVTGYSTTDHKNGYAGWEDSDILAVRCYFKTQNPPPYYKAKYRVSAVGKSYYDWQLDNETSGGQDGYAGNGVPIDRFELLVE